jgi:hypothetical protein
LDLVTEDESSRDPLEVYPTALTDVAVESKLRELERAGLEEFTGL